MEKAAAVMLAGLLAGCATTVHVPTPCVTADAIEPPSWAVERLPRDANESELAVALWAEHLQRRAYVPQLEAIIGACRQ